MTSLFCISVSSVLQNDRGETVVSKSPLPERIADLDAVNVWTYGSVEVWTCGGVDVSTFAFERSVKVGTGQGDGRMESERVPCSNHVRNTSRVGSVGGKRP